MKHFELHEFDSPDQEGSGSGMDCEFLDKLDIARGFAGISFKINSGFRTVSHNKKVGGKQKSSHLVGLAVDISCTDSRSRFLIIRALLKAGLSRIGVASSFIHVDDDPDKDGAVIWTY